MNPIHTVFYTKFGQWARFMLTAVILASTIFGGRSNLSALANTKFDIPGPAGSGAFGLVTLLPNGNFVVVDTGYDAPGSITDVGAVYLYNGATGDLISTLTGSTAGDKVGEYGIQILENGNYLVVSPHWDIGAAADVGAVTWGSEVTGVSGAVSAANSLIGSTTNDYVGLCLQSINITMLANGNYLVASCNWDNGSATDAGAVTWGSGVIGVSGEITTANSLVGSSPSDLIGSYFSITVFSNNNFAINSPHWHNGAAADAGAVTWGSGATGVKGVVSPTNSLIGTHGGDQVGSSGVVELNNHNYVVVSPYWQNGSAAAAGAVTWGDGKAGTNGQVSVANSLVGSSANDEVGLDGVTALENGNYVVASHMWANGGEAQAGAVTWGNGSVGVKGLVTAANSLVGTSLHDSVGTCGTRYNSWCPGANIMVLHNGNYVVRSSEWNGGMGAVTWGNGSIGVNGVVSASNSLVGSSSKDWVGSGGGWTFSNGNYLVASPKWDNGAAFDAGAVTWGNGVTGTNGVVSAANSLVGSTSEDFVGCSTLAADNCGTIYLTILGNGNYVVISRYWDNGTVLGAGAVTWGNAAIGVSGVVSATNSLVGTQAFDALGEEDVTALPNGNYLVVSPDWHNEAGMSVGSVTWGNGSTGIKGAATATNSLIGSTPGDGVGCRYSSSTNYSYCIMSGITVLTNGNYVVSSPYWHNGSAANTGAVTWGNGATGVNGVVSAANSLVGSTSEDQIGKSFQSYSGSPGYRDGLIVLRNGNYAVESPFWDNGTAADAGAVTWGNGTSGTGGVVSADNSLVGSSANDNVGLVTPLKNGNYVVISSYWNNGPVGDAGAVTWGSGEIGVRGAVSEANSLVGTTMFDGIGSSGIIELTNGNYVVSSPIWDNGSFHDAGAVTWGNGNSGVKGEVSAANSLVGEHAGDNVGTLTALGDGYFVVGSYLWDNVANTFTGALTLGNGISCAAGLLTGPITAANSLIVNVMYFTYDNIHRQLVVGRISDNIVSMVKVDGCAYNIYIPRTVK